MGSHEAQRGKEEIGLALLPIEMLVQIDKIIAAVTKGSDLVSRIALRCIFQPAAGIGDQQVNTEHMPASGWHLRVRLSPAQDRGPAIGGFLLALGSLALGIYMLSVTNDPALAVAKVRNIMLTNVGYALFVSPLKWGVILAPLALVFFLSFRIQSMRPSTAQITFWVYADSFELYRKLRDYLHEKDIVVAGRPLLVGMPIASSRKGTASRGQ